MYSWIFRHLPGPFWLRVIEAIILITAVVAVLFIWVFPEIAPYMPFNDNVVSNE